MSRLLRINLPVTYIRKQRLRKDISYREILSALSIIIYKGFIVLIFTCEMFRAYLLKYIDLFLILNIENYFNMELFFLINYSSCNIYTTCRCMGQRMGNAASVSDDIKSFILGFKVVINLNFHIVEFDLNTI